MNYKQISCTSALKTITRKDALFAGKYCIDPYQNCEFGCRYCDSSFEKTIYVKTDIIEALKKELIKLPPGRIIIGSVHDPYQQAEEHYELTRTILQTLQSSSFPCHILTKSPLIIRDIDLLADLNCMVTLSISSLDDSIIRIFEPQVPTLKERLNTVYSLRKREINTGIAVIPLLPYIVESEIESMVKEALRVDAKHLLYKPLELRGDQLSVFMDLLALHFPHLVSKYQFLYEQDFKPKQEYVQQLEKLFVMNCKKYKMSTSITI